MINVKLTLHTGDAVEPPGTTDAMTDQLLTEIGQLYRDRFQALQVKDSMMVQILNCQIDELKSKLRKI